MTRHSLGAAFAASFLVLQAGAAAAQNSTDPATTTPPPTSERPTTTTPPATTPEPTRTEDPAPRTTTSPEVVTVPVVVPQQTVPPPIELPETAYPNGFADPTAPFGNDMSVQVREQGDGFDWGLLGLLGLIGLLGLRRPRDGYRHVVQSERYEDGRPPRV